MAYSITDRQLGAQPGGHFGGDNHGANRCFKWDVGANAGKPIAPTDQNFSGVAGDDGKWFYFAMPGAVVPLEATIPAGQQITAGNIYLINTSGQATTGAGATVKALQTLTNGTGGTVVEVGLFEIRKPQA